MEDKLLTLDQTAKYLGVTKQTLRNWDKRGVLTPATVIGTLKHRRYTQRQLEDFVSLSEEVGQDKQDYRNRYYRVVHLVRELHKSIGKALQRLEKHV